MSKKLPVIKVNGALKSQQAIAEIHALVHESEQAATRAVQEHVRRRRGVILSGETATIVIDTGYVPEHDDAVRLAPASPQPPSLGQLLIVALVRGKRADAILGDLQERFVRDCMVHGERRARNFYRARVLNSIGPLLWSAIKKMGVVALVAAAVRKLVGG